jgi:hypothetical protein
MKRVSAELLIELVVDAEEFFAIGGQLRRKGLVKRRGAGAGICRRNQYQHGEVATIGQSLTSRDRIRSRAKISHNGLSRCLVRFPAPLSLKNQLVEGPLDGLAFEPRVYPFREVVQENPGLKCETWATRSCFEMGYF